MNLVPIIFFVFLALVVIGGLIAMLVITIPIAKSVYQDQLVRYPLPKWGRECSAPDNEEQVMMWNAGLYWAETHRACMTEVHTVSEGLNLYGEFYDFGSKRCAVILPGRCECLCYSYYFAEPFRKAGMNVLVIDTRCTGKSDGTYNTIGVHESRDAIAWYNLLLDQFHQEEIYVHCICVGSNAALMSLVAEDCPKEVQGIILDGAYVSFPETFRTHMIARKKPIFPVLQEVMFLIWKNTGTNPWKNAPIKLVKKLRQRSLFLFGVNDIFSIPPKSKKLFAACSAPEKKLVWFPKGGHSHLRLNNVELYDNTIVEFLSK